MNANMQKDVETSVFQIKNITQIVGEKKSSIISPLIQLANTCHSKRFGNHCSEGEQSRKETQKGYFQHHEI